MRNFFTLVLKIFTLLAFVGVVAFGMVVVINATAKVENAYNTISTSQRETPYGELAVLMRANVKTEAGDSGQDDNYVIFLNTAMADLNDAINYFTDYLVVNTSLDKDTQVSLKEHYDRYKNAFELTKSTYNEHLEWYVGRVNEHEQNGTQTWEGLEKSKYASNNQSILSSYADCYNAGSVFFWALFDTHRSLYYGSTLNYMGITYALRIAYADKAVANASGEINKLPAYRQNLSSRQDVSAYLDIRDDFDRFDESSVLTNNDVNTFVEDMNMIDIHRFVNDYSAYYEHSSQNLQTHISRAKSFIDTKY